MSERRNPTSRRRADCHIPLEVAVRFLRTGHSGEQVLQGELCNVSTSGIRVVLGRALRSSEKLLVEVREGRARSFDMTAQVVWTEALDDGRYQIGCELCVDLSANQLELPKQLAAANAASTVGSH